MTGLESYAWATGANALDMSHICETEYIYDANVAPYASTDQFKKDLLS